MRDVDSCMLKMYNKIMCNNTACINNKKKNKVDLIVKEYIVSLFNYKR